MSIAEKLQIIAENEQRVYEAGKQAEYDAFWDSFQDYGTPKSYIYGFAGGLWTSETLKPKYDIIPTTASQMFCQSPLTIDLYEHFSSLGVNLDFSKCTGFSELLRLSKITGIGTVDTRSTHTLGYAFSDAYDLKIIRMLILKDNGSQTFNDASFRECRNLESITIEGVIGNTINLQWSPLSKYSIESVMAALSDTTTGATITLKKTAVNAAFTTDEWNALVATKSNWTITLV